MNSQSKLPISEDHSQTVSMPSAQFSQAGIAVDDFDSSQTVLSLPSARFDQNGNIIDDDNSQTVAMRSARFDQNGNPVTDNSGELLAKIQSNSSQRPRLNPGMIIDSRYEILEVLGAGGFATVYRARHILLDTDVALKVMDIRKDADPTYAERFFREAKIAARLQHNNVVNVHDFGYIPETQQPYISMEMLHGRDLSHELAEHGPLSPKRAFMLFRPVLDALSMGHKLGIIHKDLKPENLYLIDPRGPHETMKILDFGVARISSAEGAKLTSAGQLLGTPRYLAPEYIKSQQVSPATDVYQMALIISEALTGKPAVSGDPIHAMKLHCSGNLQIADFLLEGKLGNVYRKAIAVIPELRYPDCEAFGKALDSVIDFFGSDVPLNGGEPQSVPDNGMASFASIPGSASGNISGSISGNISGNISTRISASHNMVSGNYNTPKSSLKIPLLVGSIAAAVCICIVLFLVFGSSSADQTNAAEAQQAAALGSPEAITNDALNAANQAAAAAAKATEQLNQAQERINQMNRKTGISMASTKLHTSWNIAFTKLDLSSAGKEKPASSRHAHAPHKAAEVPAAEDANNGRNTDIGAVLPF